MSRQWWMSCFLFIFASMLQAAPATLKIDPNQLLSYWPSVGPTRGGLLILYGKNTHAFPLLPKLASLIARRGWSVAMMREPVSTSELSNNLALYLARLRQKSHLRIGVLWYGDNYQALLRYFIAPRAKQVSGLVLLSAFEEHTKPGSSMLKLRFPVLDVYAQFDYQAVKLDAGTRKKNFSSRQYLQRMIPGAKHDYRLQEAYLSAALTHWLKQLPTPQIRPLELSKVKS